MMNSEPSIRVRELQPGVGTGLLGPSGSGKSTLMRSRDVLALVLGATTLRRRTA